MEKPKKKEFHGYLETMSMDLETRGYNKACDDWEKYTESKLSNLKDGKCHICGEMTESLSCNPTVWGFFIPHIDGQGKHRYYHTKCLYPILREHNNYKKKECLTCGKAFHYCSSCGTSLKNCGMLESERKAFCSEKCMKEYKEKSNGNV